MALTTRGDYHAPFGAGHADAAVDVIEHRRSGGVYLTVQVGEYATRIFLTEREAKTLAARLTMEPFDGALGPCGCIDYHYADCPTRTEAFTTAYPPDPDDDYDPDAYADEDDDDGLR